MPPPHAIDEIEEVVNGTRTGGERVWRSDSSWHATLSRTHKDGEHVRSVLVWRDGDGQLQYEVALALNDRSRNLNRRAGRRPWVQANRYISTGEDPGIREGFATTRRLVSDHGLGQAWEVAELTQDYDRAGALTVRIATDLERTDINTSNPHRFDVDPGDRILLQGIPDLPSDRDYLWAWIEDGETLAGSWGGVAGEFSCAQSSRCWFWADHNTLNGWQAGRRTTGLTFTPDGGTARAVPPFDAPPPETVDYLSFGTWLYVPHDPAAAADYDFGTFASGGDPFTNAHIKGLTGTAAYAGKAMGMYYAGGLSQNPEVGSFTADVELMADFGTIDDFGTIGGDVSNFSFDGDVASMFPATLALEANVSSWYRGTFEIEQGKRNIFEGYKSGDTHRGGFVEGHVRGRTGGDTGDGDWYGRWNAKLFGNGAVPTDHPTSVGGVFSAYELDYPGDESDRGLSGAFGAHRQ